MPGQIQETLRFVKMTQEAYAPTRGSAEAAGYDLYRLEYISYKQFHDRQDLRS